MRKPHCIWFLLDGWFNNVLIGLKLIFFAFKKLKKKKKKKKNFSFHVGSNFSIIVFIILDYLSLPPVLPVCSWGKHAGQ